ncbi:hypothetical protein P9112_003992 [Eukaryota sp. TZLM1-RC]
MKPLLLSLRKLKNLRTRLSHVTSESNQPKPPLIINTEPKLQANCSTPDSSDNQRVFRKGINSSVLESFIRPGLESYELRQSTAEDQLLPAMLPISLIP